MPEAAAPGVDIIVVCGPLAVGKSTLVQMLRTDYPEDLDIPVPSTSRPPKAKEENGVHYHFIPPEQAQAAIAEGQWIEHSQPVRGEYYGMSRAAVEAVTSTGRTCIIEADLSTLKQIKTARLNARYVAILPPSTEVHEARMRGRCGASARKTALSDRKALAEPGVVDVSVINGDDLHGVCRELAESIAQWRDLTLSREVSRRGLTQLGSTANGTKLAFLSLQAKGTSVTRLDILSTLPQLQTVDLSNNCLIDLAALSQLKSLLYLTVASNRLQGAALASLPTSLLTLSASHNEISSMSGLATLDRLQELDLSHNLLSAVSGVSGLAQLMKLDVSHNKLKDQVALPLPVSLRELSMISNQITALVGLDHSGQMPMLTRLDASHNKISRLRGLELCPALVTLLLNDNQVANTQALQPLHKPDSGNPLKNLAVLDLTNCDITKKESYRLNTLYPLLKANISLETLDGESVSAEEKVSALNKIGNRDKSTLNKIREKHFPTKTKEQEDHELEVAASSLQATYRGFADRKALREARAAEAEAQRQRKNSAISIQSRYRGKLARTETNSRLRKPKAP